MGFGLLFLLMAIFGGYLDYFKNWLKAATKNNVKMNCLR